MQESHRSPVNEINEKCTEKNCTKFDSQMFYLSSKLKKNKQKNKTNKQKKNKPKKTNKQTGLGLPIPTGR